MLPAPPVKMDTISLKVYAGIVQLKIFSVAYVIKKEILASPACLNMSSRTIFVISLIPQFPRSLTLLPPQPPIQLNKIPQLSQLKSQLKKN